jgi:hypothetical protein
MQSRLALEGLSGIDRGPPTLQDNIALSYAETRTLIDIRVIGKHRRDSLDIGTLTRRLGDAAPLSDCFETTLQLCLGLKPAAKGSPQLLSTIPVKPWNTIDHLSELH